MRKDERPAGEDVESSRALVETEDYYIEDGLMVLTSEFLRRRGYCCENSCRNCPYQKDTGKDRNYRRNSSSSL